MILFLLAKNVPHANCIIGKGYQGIKELSIGHKIQYYNDFVLGESQSKGQRASK